MLKVKKRYIWQITVIIAMLIMIAAIITCKDFEENKSTNTEEIDVYCALTDDKDTTKCSLYSVSIYALLSNIKDFEGKRVVTLGYLYADTTFEEPAYALYPNEIDFEKRMFLNALWLEVIENNAELYRGMKAPYGIYTFIQGDVSLDIGNNSIRHGIKNAEVNSPRSFRNH